MKEEEDTERQNRESGLRYCLAVGEAAARRLLMLDEIIGPHSRERLRRAGLTQGMRVADIAGVPVSQGGPIRRLLVGLLYWRTRRRLGHVIVPVQVTAHHPRILWGYEQMERSQAGTKLVDAKLKGVPELRVATLVGCPF